MKKHTCKTYILFILLTEAVGALSALMTRTGMQTLDALQQPELTPPGPAFSIVWALLYALMGIGAARIYLKPPKQLRSNCLTVFAIQLIFNFFWSLFYFNLRAFGFSFFWLLALWLLILTMILCYRKLDKAAAWLQVPYLLWVSFAAYLNYAMWRIQLLA